VLQSIIAIEDCDCLENGPVFLPGIVIFPVGSAAFTTRYDRRAARKLNPKVRVETKEGA